jgi:hypothetical protein
MEIKQAVFAELDAVTPGHAILASNTSSLSITEIGDATLRPDKVVGFHYFYPASVMPLIEIVEGDDTRRRRPCRRVNFAQAIRKQPITCEEVPGSSSTASSTAASARSGARRRRALSIKKIDEGGRGERRADGAVLPDRPARPRHRLHVAEHLNESYGDRFYVHKGCASSSRRQARGQDRRRGLLQGRRAQAATATPTRRETLAELLTLEAVRRGVPRARGGRRTSRDIDLGLMAAPAWTRAAACCRRS